ncbi:MAG: hypothetical protein PWR32_646 [Candidatus Woesearchaeota archaeon]|nr:hypothetical protein [Candidatus Woesearchaeota archaeon]
MPSKKKKFCIPLFILLVSVSLSYSTDIINIIRILPSNTYLNLSGSMYISSTNIGIGTENPSSTLHVVGNITITNGLIVSSGTVDLPAGQIDDAEIADLSWTKLKNYPAACNVGQAIQALNDTITCIDVGGSSSSNLNGSGSTDRIAKFTANNTLGNAGITDSSTSLAITIDSNGNVGIGTTNPTYKLYVAGTAYSTGGWQSSDERLKNKIDNLTNVLNKISNLEAFRFKWKTKEFPNKGLPNGTHLGVSAQQVQKVFPELINYDNEGYLAVDYAGLTVVNLAAIKEMKAEIERLQKEIAKIDELKKEVKMLKTQLDQLKEIQNCK